MPPNTNLLEICQLLFPQKKLKLGQNYQSTEKRASTHGYCFTWSLAAHGHVFLCARVSGCQCLALRDKPSKSELGRAHRRESSAQPHTTTKPLLSDAILTYHPTQFFTRYSRISPSTKPTLYSCLRGTAHARLCNWLLNNWPVWEAVGRRLILGVNITASRRW